tara:strand:- start:467 stop:685 length:219 start_codon:yes stop_codon:yes gene_type:complete
MVKDTRMLDFINSQPFEVDTSAIVKATGLTPSQVALDGRKLRKQEAVKARKVPGRRGRGPFEKWVYSRKMSG